MKRVLHIWQAAYPWEVRVAKLNRAFLGVGAEVLVLARRGHGEVAREVRDGVEIRRVGFASGPLKALSLPITGNPVWARAIARAIAEFKPDLIVVRDIPLCPMAARIARKAGVRVVLDMAEHYPEAMRSWRKYSENPVLRKIVHDWRLPDRVEASAVKLVDGVVVVCQEQKDRLMREYGVDSERMCVVMNTLELKTWSDFPRGSKKGNEHKAKAIFGYHGNLCEDRALEFVLKGFDLAAKKDPEIQLLIAGGGESEAALLKLAASLDSAARIRFTGRYLPEALAALYAETDFGIVSLRANVFTEHTLANKFFDYAALGKPFIYTALAPLNRVMARMRCGVPFASGSAEAVAEAMLAIRSRSYDELAENGARAVTEEFNWDVDVRRMTEFLKGVNLTQPRPPGVA